MLILVNQNLATLLAMSDGWAIGLNLLNLGVSVCLALGMFWLNQKTQRIETLESQLQTKTTQLVETLIAHKIAELNTSIQVLGHSLGEVERRLQRGDDSFDTIDERWRNLELKLVERLASKEDLRELNSKMDRLSERFGGLQLAVAKVEGR